VICIVHSFDLFDKCVIRPTIYITVHELCNDNLFRLFEFTSFFILFSTTEEQFEQKSGVVREDLVTYV